MRICAKRSGPPTWSMPTKPLGAMTASVIMYGLRAMNISPFFISTGIAQPRWPKAIFGENFDGILVRDRYAAYNGIGVAWQSCWRISSPTPRKSSGNMPSCRQPKKTPRLSPFCNRLMDLCSRLCEMGQKIKSGDIPWKAASSIEKQLHHGNSITSANDHFDSNPPRPCGLISQDPNRNFSLPSSDTPVCPPPTIMRNSLSGIW